MIGWLAAGAVLASWILLFLRIDPVPTWFYVFAWYPSLVLLDRVGSRGGRPSALWRRSALSLFAWSPVIWLVFEAANFRLRNWYYVFLPEHGVERWTGIVLSFATVVPAIVLAERALEALGLFREGGGPAIPVGRPTLWILSAAGALMGALALLLPRACFPLIWGAAVLLVDPLVFRKRPELSLLADIDRGHWGRIGRLLVGGLGIGLLWESYNYWAQGKWIYTVPWFEQLKLFEMPPLGFVGFSVFALEAWAMYAVLCTYGVAIPPRGGPGILPRRAAVAAVLAIAFVTTVLAGMESRTISSTVPALIDLPNVTATEVSVLRNAHIDDPFQLARVSPERLTTGGGMELRTAERLTETARLVTLRGIGARHARALADVGVLSVCDLARREATMLHASMSDRERGHRPTLAEVRIWIRAAARHCAP